MPVVRDRRRHTAENAALTRAEQAQLLRLDDRRAPHILERAIGSESLRAREQSAELEEAQLTLLQPVGLGAKLGKIGELAEDRRDIRRAHPELVDRAESDADVRGNAAQTYGLIARTEKAVPVEHERCRSGARVLRNSAYVVVLHRAVSARDAVRVAVVVEDRTRTAVTLQVAGHVECSTHDARRARVLRRGHHELRRARAQRGRSLRPHVAQPARETLL